MRLWTCDKDGFNAEPVAGTDGIKGDQAFAIIPLLYEACKVMSISFNNPYGTASIRVEVEVDDGTVQNDYYYIQ